MHAFTYYAPTRLCFGQGVCSSLGEEVRKYGNRVLLVYGGGSIKRTGIYQKVMEQLTALRYGNYPEWNPTRRSEPCAAGLRCVRKITWRWC